MLIFLYCASFHVATIDKGRPPTLEVQELGAKEHQEQQEPEQYEIADQDQAYDYYDYTNSSNLQGKHRSILTQSLISVKSLVNLSVH